MKRDKLKLIDLHCDTFFRIVLAQLEGRTINLKENDLHVDIERLKKVGASGQMFAAYIPAQSLSQYGFDGTPYDFLKLTYKKMLEELEANKGDIALATNYLDYEKIMANGKISAFLTIEEGCILDGKIERLDEIYDMGFRFLGLIWMPENCIGFAHSKDPEVMAKGLKPFGFEVVERMNEIGMVIDVSHLSDGGFYDVAKHSKQPFVATHSNCRAIANESRNLTDDMIKILANKGGVMGLNLVPAFLDASNKSRIEYMVKHIKHIKNVGGIDTVAIGADFDGMGGDLEIDNIGDMDKLFDALVKEGFTWDEIDKIAYKNVLRVIRDVIG